MDAYRGVCAVAACVALVGCQSKPTLILPTSAPTLSSTAALEVEPSATAAPTDAPTAIPTMLPTERVIVLSIPALNAVLASNTILADLPNYPLQSVELATTVVTHHSLASGLLPANTGIVGERVHLPTDGFYWYTSAFDLPMQNSIPIWQTANEQNLTTAALFWPGAIPSFPDQLADYTVAYGARDAYSSQHELTLYAAGIWTDAPASFSSLLESQFTVQGDRTSITLLYLLALDTSDDDASNYDTFILSKDRVVGDDDATSHNAEWAQLTLDPALGQGADFLITQVDGNQITLFQSRVYHVLAAPDALRQEVVEKFGYFAPEPDWYGLEQGWLTPEQYLAMVKRQSDWMMDVTLWVNGTYQPDLLFTAQNPLDQAGRQFLMVDPRQPDYSPESAAQYHELMLQAAAQVDRVTGELLEAADPTTAVFVVSPTSLVPVHTEVNLNKVLADAGLLRLGNNGFVIVQSSEAIAFTSGGAAHIYINLVDRELAGIVSVDQYEAIQSQIVELFSGMVDPQTGEAVFARVLRHDELAPLGLDGDYAGDVFVQANVGYTLDDDRRAREVFEPVSFYGQQGFDRRGMVWMLNAPSVQRDPLELIDIVPSIAHLLNFALPAADGQSIFANSR